MSSAIWKVSTNYCSYGNDKATGALHSIVVKL